MHATATICAASSTMLSARNGPLQRSMVAIPTPPLCRQLPRRTVQAAAISPEVYTLAAEVGQVDAPVWVLPVAAIIVTIGLSLSSFLLKPGVEAFEESQEMLERAKKQADKKK